MLCSVLRGGLETFIPPRTHTATVSGTFQQQTHRSKALGWLGKHPLLWRC